MAGSQAVTVEGFVFPPTVKAPGSDEHFIFGGAGVRGVEIPGKFIKVTTMAIYLEEGAIPVLSAKWKGKTADELAISDEFFQDIVSGPFEKLLHVSFLVPMTGPQYSEKVSEHCVETWKTDGIYTDKEAKAIEKFLDTFKDQQFPPGHSIFYTLSHLGSLTIAFSKHDSIPEAGVAVIESKNLVEVITDSSIGKTSVSPDTKNSLAAGVSQLLNNN